jgi:hypothetical protein
MSVPDCTAFSPKVEFQQRPDAPGGFSYQWRVRSYNVSNQSFYIESLGRAGCDDGLSYLSHEPCDEGREPWFGVWLNKPSTKAEIMLVDVPGGLCSELGMAHLVNL